jgi:hypothetical protein
VAIEAKGFSVGDLEPGFREIGPVKDVVGVKDSTAFSAVLAGIVITFENGPPPFSIFLGGPFNLVRAAPSPFPTGVFIAPLPTWVVDHRSGPISRLFAFFDRDDGNFRPCFAPASGSGNLAYLSLPFLATRPFVESRFPFFLKRFIFVTCDGFFLDFALRRLAHWLTRPFDKARSAQLRVRGTYGTPAVFTERFRFLRYLIVTFFASLYFTVRFVLEQLTAVMAPCPAILAELRAIEPDEGLSATLANFLGFGFRCQRALPKKASRQHGPSLLLRQRGCQRDAAQTISVN